MTRKLVNQRVRLMLLLLAATGVTSVAYEQHPELLWEIVPALEPAPPALTIGTFQLRKPRTEARLVAEYSFDRNALGDVRRVGDSLVALSSAGHVLFFDAATLQPTGEQLLRRSAVCLGAEDNASVVLGISNGQVVRLNVATRALDPVSEVPGRPSWLGRRAGGGLVVAYAAVDGGKPSSWVKDVVSSRQVAVAPASAFLLDSRERLWLGGSGKNARVQMVGLRDLALKEVPLTGTWGAIAGMAELPDGSIAVHGWSAGGAGLVARLAAAGAGAAWTPLVADRDSSLPATPAPPLTHLVVDPARDRVVAFSPEDVLVTDLKLAAWRPLDLLALAKLPGRPPHLRGRSPAVGRAVVSSERLIVATARDGFLLAEAARVHRHALAEQNPVLRPRELSTAGALTANGDGAFAHYEDGRWKPAPEPPLPPRELLGKPIPGQPRREWVAVRTLARDAKTTYVVAKGGLPRSHLGHLHGIRDNVVTARLSGGTFTVLGSEESAVEPDDTFLSPDGQLWNIDPEAVWKFFDGRWRPFGKSPVPEALRFVPGAGPPWIGVPLGKPGSLLVRFDPNEGGEAALLDELPVAVDGAAVEVRDALAWGKDRLLVASNVGLCVFDTSTRFCDHLTIDGLDESPSLLWRDPVGRVWLAGRGLWLLEGGKRALAIHSSLPFMGESTVLAMASSADGRLVLGLDGRGVALLTIPRRFEPGFPTVARLQPWEEQAAHERP